MKYLAAVSAILIATQAIASEPHSTWEPRGMWKTMADKTGVYLLVEVRDCDRDLTKLCSEIKQVLNSEHQEIVGKPVFWNLEPTSENRWENGKIWDVANDKIYNGRMMLSETAMRVEGCVAIFCEGQNWSRVEE